MNVSSAILISFSVLALYVGLYHLVFYALTRERRIDLDFSLLCFTVALYNLFGAGLYGATNTWEGAMWQRCQSIALAGLGIFVLWFVADFVGRKGRLAENLLSLYYLVQASMLLVERQGLTWTDIPSIKEFSIFGNSVVTYYEVEPGPLVIVQTLVGFFLMLYVMWSLLSFYLAGNRRKTLPVLVGMGVLCAGIINDACIACGLYQFVYMIEYSHLFLVIGMAYSLMTSHIKAQKGLRQSTDELRRLAKAVDDAAESIIITDTKGVILYVNPKFEEMTGFSRDEILGKTPALLHSGKHDAAFYNELWGTISRGRTWRGCFTNRRKNGTLFQEEAVISPIYDNERIVSYVAVKRDVTQETLLEHQLRQSQKMEAIGRLAGGLAHDFTNKLVVIQNCAKLARSRIGTDPDLCELLDEIIEASSRSTKLTGQLMAFAHKQPITLQKINLNRIVSGIRELLGRTLGSEIRLTIHEFPEPLPIEADPSQIEQAIMHLAVNARDAMPAGGTLTIETRQLYLSKSEAGQLHEGIVEETRIHGKLAIISVSDTGTGIKRDVLPHIFEPFFSTKGYSQSTGLGLSTVYGIAKQHSGHISVLSDEGRGSTFMLYIPMKEQPGEAASTSGEPDPTGNETIMVLDENALSRRTLVGILQSLGYSVLEAETVPQATGLAMTRQAPIHLLIVHIGSLRKDKQDLVAGIRQVRQNATILFTSGSPLPHLLAAGDLSSDDLFMNKPYTMGVVARTVRAILDGNPRKPV